jgi:hypothetical protein
VGSACRREEGKGNGTGSGEVFLGRGLDLELGQIVSPGAFSIFISPLLLFFFCFLNSFKSFARKLQFKTNFFQKFLKDCTLF